MKIIAIGSYALNHYFPQRKYKDLDVIIHFDDLDNFKNQYNLVSLVPSKGKFHGTDNNNFHYEIEVVDLHSDSANEMYKLVDTFVKDSKGISIPPLDLLYQIKMTHRFKYSVHFEKNRNDILMMRNYVSKEINKEWKRFLKKRSDEAKVKTPVLKGVNKDQFFTSKYGDVTQIVHDTIHLTQALGEKPAYMSFQVGEVECCMKTFFEVDEQIRLNSIFEESATLAIERAIWPSQFNTNEFLSFKNSLQRLCCHISSGRFRDYAWENYDKVLAMYKNGDIVRRFKDGIENGTIKFTNQEVYHEMV